MFGKKAIIKKKEKNSCILFFHVLLFRLSSAYADPHKKKSF